MSSRFFDPNGSDVKKCSGLCGRELPLNRFHRSSSSGDGRQSDCKACQKARKHNELLYDGLKKQVDLKRMGREMALVRYQAVDKKVVW